MLKRKVTLYAVMLFALAACTKQDIRPTTAVTSEKTLSATSQAVQGTVSGLAKEKADPTTTVLQHINLTEGDLDKAGISMARVEIALSKTSASKSIDQFLKDGYDVQILASWDTGKSSLKDFPTPAEIDRLRSQAEAFFQYYAPYKDHIPFVVVENEWDHMAQNGAIIQDYLNELSVITEVGHKYGFKIADGGITSVALRRWTYSQLSGKEQQQWFANYYVGLKNGYSDMLNIVNTYIAGAKNIDFDYSNVHWYNETTCANGFARASQLFMKACNKTVVSSNEFGILTNSSALFDSTLAELRGNVNFAVAYSGSNQPGKAVMLTDEMLAAL